MTVKCPKCNTGNNELGLDFEAGMSVDGDGTIRVMTDCYECNHSFTILYRFWKTEEKRID